MQYGSNSFRPFLFAVAIHLVIVILILMSQYEGRKKTKRYHEPIIAISLTNPYIQPPVVTPPTQSVRPPVKAPTQESKKAVIVEESTREHEEKEIKSEIVTPIIPMGRIAGLIKRHYGDIFADLTPEEQAYIIENIVTIHRIDRRIGNALLSEKAPNLFKDGDSNYVEMFLYPDGTVSDITLINERANLALDELTMETVERSYSQYPPPKQKTLIRLHTRIQRGK